MHVVKANKEGILMGVLVTGAATLFYLLRMKKLKAKARNKPIEKSSYFLPSSEEGARDFGSIPHFNSTDDLKNCDKGTSKRLPHQDREREWTQQHIGRDDLIESEPLPPPAHSWDGAILFPTGVILKAKTLDQRQTQPGCEERTWTLQSKQTFFTPGTAKEGNLFCAWSACLVGGNPTLQEKWLATSGGLTTEPGYFLLLGSVLKRLERSLLSFLIPATKTQTSNVEKYEWLLLKQCLPTLTRVERWPFWMEATYQ